MADRLTCAGCGIGIPPSRGGRARKWCSDRCRKRQYDLECVDCGGRVDGTTPGSMANRGEPVCRACAPEHYAIWTREAIVCAIQEWAAEHDGRAPVATDWNPNQALTVGHPEKAVKFYRDRCWPTVSQVQFRFGSWNAAIEAADMEPRPRGLYGRPGEGIELCRELRARYEAGESTYALGQEFGVTATAIAYRVRKAGGQIRSRGEANVLRWSRQRVAA